MSVYLRVNEEIIKLCETKLKSIKEGDIGFNAKGGGYYVKGYYGEDFSCEYTKPEHLSSHLSRYTKNGLSENGEAYMYCEEIKKDEEYICTLVDFKLGIKVEGLVFERDIHDICKYSITSHEDLKELKVSITIPTDIFMLSSQKNINISPLSNSEAIKYKLLELYESK